VSAQNSSLTELKKRLAVANRVMGYWYNTLGLDNILMTLGHVSERLDDGNRFLVKGRPPVDDMLIKTRSHDIVTVNLDAVKVGGSDDVSIPGETKLHSSIYKNRDDVRAVCHAHPHFAVLTSILDLKLRPICNEGIDLFPIPVFRNNALISTDELGMGLVERLGKANACLLRGHGSVTLAGSCEEAVIRMMQLEEQARLNLYAFIAKGPSYKGIPQDHAERYIQATWESLRRSGLSEERIKSQISGLSIWNYLVEQVASDV
jgi:3,4-dihydroxyphthalate decarboxylase